MKFAQYDIQQGHAGLYAWSNACHIRYAERANVLFLPNEVHLSVVRRPRPRSVSSFNIAFYRILKARCEYASCSEHRDRKDCG